MSATFHCQKANEVRRFTIRPIIYTISKIPQLPGTRSCSIVIRTERISRWCWLSENEIPSGPLRASTREWYYEWIPMGEERVQREERDWFESLEPLQPQWNREKNPYGHFLIAQWNWLLASPLSLLLRLAARVSMLLRHNSDTYRQDSWLYTWWGRMARKVVGTKGEGERNSMWLSQWASWMTSTEEEVP